MTHCRNHDWRDSFRFYEDCLKKIAQQIRPRLNYGLHLMHFEREALSRGDCHLPTRLASKQHIAKIDGRFGGISQRGQQRHTEKSRPGTRRQRRRNLHQNGNLDDRRKKSHPPHRISGSGYGHRPGSPKALAIKERLEHETAARYYLDHDQNLKAAPHIRHLLELYPGHPNRSFFQRQLLAGQARQNSLH